MTVSKCMRIANHKAIHLKSVECFLSIIPQLKIKRSFSGYFYHQTAWAVEAVDSLQAWLRKESSEGDRWRELLPPLHQSWPQLRWPLIQEPQQDIHSELLLSRSLLHSSNLFLHALLTVLTGVTLRHDHPRVLMGAAAMPAQNLSLCPSPLP